ncbi:MAG TPA: hypothetical protein VMY35_11220 [Phycisphaerae bacterium]|nr:hypothetical protein [Phycisphaerae bacterium]
MTTALRIALVLLGVGCVAYSTYKFPYVKRRWQQYALAGLDLAGMIAVGMAIGPYLVALWRIVGGGL